MGAMNRRPVTRPRLDLIRAAICSTFDQPMPSSEIPRRHHPLGTTAVPGPPSPTRTDTDPRPASSFQTSSILARPVRAAEMDPNLVEHLIGEHTRAMEKRCPRPSCASSRRDGRCKSQRPDRLRVEADRSRPHFREGNAARAALGAVYFGATSFAWYPITPASSLADALRQPLQDAAARSRNRQVEIRHRAGRGHLASIGSSFGASWERARRLYRDLRPGISRMRKFIGLSYFARDPGRDQELQRAGPSTVIRPAPSCDIMAAPMPERLIEACPAVSGTRPKPHSPPCLRSRAAATTISSCLVSTSHEPPDEPPLKWTTHTIRPRNVMTAEMLEEGRDFGPLSRRRDATASPTPYPGTPSDQGFLFHPGTSRDATRVIPMNARSMPQHAAPPAAVLKFETARTGAAAAAGHAAKPPVTAVIYFARPRRPMDEAIGLLEARGHQLDRLRPRFPVSFQRRKLLADHDFVYGRAEPAMPASLADVNETASIRSGCSRSCLRRPRSTARFIAGAIGDHRTAQVTSSAGESMRASEEFAAIPSPRARGEVRIAPHPCEGDSRELDSRTSPLTPTLSPRAGEVAEERQSMT